MSGILYLNRLEEGTNNAEIEITSEELAVEHRDIVEVGGYFASMTIEKHSNEFIVRCQADAIHKLQCARCLEPFSAHYSFDFAFVIHSVKPQEAAGEDSSDDFFVIEDSLTEFDITPLIRERLLLAIPMKPLCNPDCKGLCPECGIDLNKDTCNCVKDQIDERWSELKKIRQQLGGN